MVDNAQVSSSEAEPAPDENADFPTLRRAGFGREGYRVDEVDAFLDTLQRAMESDPPTMAPYEVADHRFGVVRWRKGYALRDVDEYLARAQEVLRTRHGDDPVADLPGRVEDRRHFPTGWIYIVALVLIVLIVVAAISQF